MRRIGLLPLLVACLVGFVSAAQAGRPEPVDTFDIDVLTAYRYGLNHDWAPARCFGRAYCPEDRRPRTVRTDSLPWNSR